MVSLFEQKKQEKEVKESMECANKKENDAGRDETVTTVVNERKQESVCPLRNDKPYYINVSSLFCVIMVAFSLKRVKSQVARVLYAAKICLANNKIKSMLIEYFDVLLVFPDHVYPCEMVIHALLDESNSNSTPNTPNINNNNHNYHRDCNNAYEDNNGYNTYYNYNVRQNQLHNSYKFDQLVYFDASMIFIDNIDNLLFNKIVRTNTSSLFCAYDNDDDNDSNGTKRCLQLKSCKNRYKWNNLSNCFDCSYNNKFF